MRPKAFEAVGSYNKSSSRHDTEERAVNKIKEKMHYAGHIFRSSRNPPRYPPVDTSG